jgi:hypothetical protein
MSEYQYYEFQTVDQLLTKAEQQAVSQLSSRVQLSPTNKLRQRLSEIIDNRQPEN